MRKNNIPLELILIIRAPVYKALKAAFIDPFTRNPPNKALFESVGAPGPQTLNRECRNPGTKHWLPVPSMGKRRVFGLGIRV